MNLQRLHPELDVLEAFGLGKVDEEQAVLVAQHLAECPACCDTLLELQDDSFIELVRVADMRSGNGPLTVGPSGSREVHEPGDCNEVNSLPPELAAHPRYRVLHLLGRGGMGEVYKAEHRLMNRPVALKVVDRQLLKNPRAVERFRREVQAAARLSHPNIVAAYDAERAGDLHFLAMEYVAGTDLAEIVRRHGPLPVGEACEYIRQAAAGLQHAHQHGMIHRDIKPQNLMLVEAQEAEGGGRKEEMPNPTHLVPLQAHIKILDFGLARFAAELDDADGGPQVVLPGRLTSLGATMGTPDYIAPEQAVCARDADIRSDIYSLGCSLYFLLAGRPPFDGTSAEKLNAHGCREPQSLSERRNDLPPGLEQVLQRMMAKDPRDRYETPDEVASALATFAEPKPVPAASVRRVRPPALVGLAAALVLLLIAVFYIRLGETTVRFEIDDPTLALRFGKDEITFESDGRPIRITPGRQQSVTVLQDGLEAQTTAFTLSRGQRVILRATIKEGEIAVTSSDRTLRLDPPTRPAVAEGSAEPIIKPRLTFQGTQAGSEIMVMGVSADRKTIVTCHDGGLMAVWDAATRRQVAGWKKPPGLAGYVLAVSPDGRRIALVTEPFPDRTTHSVRIADATTGEQLRELPDVEGLGSLVTFSPDGRLLLSGGWVGVDPVVNRRIFGFGAAIHLWNLDTGQAAARLEMPALLAASADDEKGVYPGDIAFSPDGTRVAAVGTTIRYEDGHRVDHQHWGHVWETKTGRLLANVAANIGSSVFTPDGQFLVAGHFDVDAQRASLQMWSTATGELARVIPGNQTWGGACRDVSPDGRLAATLSGDGVVQIWHLAEQRVVASVAPPTFEFSPLGHARRPPVPIAVAFLNDSRSFVTADHEGVKLWRLPER